MKQRRLIRIKNLRTGEKTVLESRSQVEEFMKSIDLDSDFSYQVKAGIDVWPLEFIEDKEQLQYDLYRIRCICIQYLNKR